MIKDDKIRKKLIALLPSNYRQIVADRVGCHPNTVYNVLHHENDNPQVEAELFTLAKEEKDKRNEHEGKIASIAKQL
jgi:hypothetical protein